MTCKQAKVLSDADLRRLLIAANRNRYPERDGLIILLSTKAGLRAGEIALLTWPMVLDPHGRIAAVLELRNHAAKKGSGRTIPLHPMLRDALKRWLACQKGSHLCSSFIHGPIITSERISPVPSGMRASSIVNWFAALYAECGLVGCSSHSGRRTFVTKAAKAVHKAGGSLRDVQQLAGHRSISMTQRYIDGDTHAQHRLVRLI